MYELSAVINKFISNKRLVISVGDADIAVGSMPLSKADYLLRRYTFRFPHLFIIIH